MFLADILPLQHVGPSFEEHNCPSFVWLLGRSRSQQDEHEEKKEDIPLSSLVEGLSSSQYHHRFLLAPETRTVLLFLAFRATAEIPSEHDPHS